MTKQKQILIIVILILPLLYLANRLIPTNSPATHTLYKPLIIHTEQKPLIIQVEEALTKEQKEQGLMHRKHLPKLHGMLFRFTKAQQIHMWMKDTHIPLDIIFIGESKRITKIITNTTPFSLTPLPSPPDTIAVIEVNAGTTKNHYIHIDNKVVLP